MNRLVLLPVAGALVGLLAALNAQGAPESLTPRFGFPAWKEKCEMENQGYTPEGWTRRDDAERVLNGRYVEPVAIRCVLGSYRMPALKRAAAAGDPIAHLALGYDLLTETEQPCTRLSEIEHELAAAAKPLRSSYALPAVAGGAAPLARAPEAALLLSQAFAACGKTQEARVWKSRAWDLGMDTRSATSEVYPLD